MSDLSNVAALAQQATAHQGHANSADDTQESVAIRRLFMVLHGAYGAAFISKYATGQRDGEGDDKGVLSAMKVWQIKLAAYPSPVLSAATVRVLDAHPEFPPTLPQFEALCRAAMPRKTFAQEQGLPQLPAPPAAPRVVVEVTLRNDGKDWARKILAGVEAGDRRTPSLVRFAKEALGLAHA